MQSPAEFSREHQPAYVPATNRVLAGFLTMGVYALVLVVANHRAPPHAAPSAFATRMEPQTLPFEQAARQAPAQNTRQEARQDIRRNASQTPVEQQSASRQPSLLERLFAPRDQRVASAPGAAPGPDGQSAAKPSSGGAPAQQLASVQSALAEKSSSPSASSTSGQQEASNAAKDKTSACQDAAWLRAVTNRLRPFYSAAARRQRASGTATAHLVIRRSGWLNELEIATTSGNAALDAAAYVMVRKAQPLPRIPDRIAADRIDLALPIAFGATGDFKITVNACGPR